MMWYCWINYVSHGTFLYILVSKTELQLSSLSLWKKLILLQVHVQNQSIGLNCLITRIFSDECLTNVFLFFRTMYWLLQWLNDVFSSMHQTAKILKLPIRVWNNISCFFWNVSKRMNILGYLFRHSVIFKNFKLSKVEFLLV